MIRRASRCGLVGLLAWLSLASAPASAPAAGAPYAGPPDIASLHADALIVSEALQIANGQGVAAIAPRLDSLKAVLTHAPKPYSIEETLGGVTYVRIPTPADAPVALASASEEQRAQGREGQVVALEDPYPIAALLIGSFLDESGDFEGALAVLDQGFDMRRDIMPLTAERGAALIALERPQEALETYVLGLAALPPGAAAPSRAVLLRGEGAALTDLGRLDEAQIAYLRSLDLEPGHAGALGELAYIARMRAGAKPTATRLVITRDGGKPP